MSVTKTGERASPRAAYSPPNPPPTITTRGRLSGIAVVDERMAHLSRTYDRLAPLVLMARVLDSRRRPQMMDDCCIALTHTELSLLLCAREGGEAAPIPDASSCAEACPVIESVEGLFGSGQLDAKQQRVRHRNNHLREARTESGMSPSQGTANGPTLPPPAAPVQSPSTSGAAPRSAWLGATPAGGGGTRGGPLAPRVQRGRRGGVHRPCEFPIRRRHSAGGTALLLPLSCIVQAQTSVPEWDRQFRLMRVHHEHREELGRLRLAGIGGAFPSFRSTVKREGYQSCRHNG